MPDLRNDRLLIYSNSSANTTFGSPEPGSTPASCAGIDVIEVPLDDPASASYLRFEPAGDPMEEEHHSCHDTGVIQGEANLVACAGTAGGTNTGVNVFSTDPADGGSKEDPQWLYHKVTGGISLGHSASFTWDGEVLIVGHEPGGGAGANCEATDNPLERTFFFLDAGPATQSASSRSRGRRPAWRTARRTTTTSCRRRGATSWSAGTTSRGSR